MPQDKLDRLTDALVENILSTPDAEAPDGACEFAGGQMSASAISPDEMLVKLREAVATAGSQRAYARAIGVSEQYVCDCLSGRRDIGKSISEPLGYHPTTIYIPIES